MGSLNSHGFNSDLYYEIDDFTQKIALVPTSAKTKQGIQELIMVICGLSQSFLKDKLKMNKEAKGVILEVKKEKGMNFAEAILYDGILDKKNEIAIANFEENADPTISKIRILEEIQPLCSRFKPVEKAQASTGLRMQLITKQDILSGMPFELFNNNLEEIKEKFNKEISENIKTSKKGIIAKADSLGSLEALLVLLEEAKIPVVKAGIGPINKTDIISAKANLEISELDSIVIGFNTKIEYDAKELSKAEGGIKYLTDEVVYKLIEDLIEWRKGKAQEIEKKRLMELTTVCKLEILKQYVFRNSNPAVFGVKVVGGKLKKETNLINAKGEKVARVKNIEADKKSVDEATEGMEVAISLPGVNFERVLGEEDFLYSELGASQFKKFKENKDLLTENEKKVLMELKEIKGF